MRILLLSFVAVLAFGQTKKPAANYKEVGSSSAPIRFEAYTDYECPHCAAFFRDIEPKLMEQYVRTGKVLFVHRDFPLPVGPNSVLAAKYANAAGELGQYELVVNQLFGTQEEWGVEGKKTGDVDGEVAKVLARGLMLKVREKVKSDPHLDDGMKKDVAMGNSLDHVRSTPTLVIVSKGKREVISATLPWSVWKNYIDSTLAGQ